jgi:1-phosphofructokinase
VRDARHPGRRRLLRAPRCRSRSPLGPNLIKPNHEELAELVGHDLPTLGDVRAAARDLVADGIEVVAVSLGSDGALLVTADEAVHAGAAITAPLSTVGAGDCMLAGLLHGLSTGMRPADALATAVTWGSAAVTLPGSRVPTPSDLVGIHAEVTHSPDPSLVLR